MPRPGDPRAIHIAVFGPGSAIERVSEGIGTFFLRFPELAATREDVIPPALVTFVRAQIEAARKAGETEATALYLPNLIVRIAWLARDERELIAVTFSAFAMRDPVRAAERRFRLTRREREVLALLLSGMRGSEIARELGLSEATIGDYFKRLRQKTRARTRSGMIATLLGWTAPALPAVDAENAC